MKKLLLLLFLTGCAKEQFPQIPYQNPDLLPTANLVLEEGVKRGKNYSIQHIGLDYATLKNNKSSMVGECIKYGSSRTILVDHSFWIYNNSYREQIMAHELGHCLLNIGHENDYTNGYPVSLMNEYVVEDYVFHNHRDYYYDQLFLR